MKDQQAKKSKVDRQEEAPSQEGSSSAEDTSGSHLLPFSKPYNDYFEAMGEAQRELRQRAAEAYETYLKAARNATEAQDAEALRLAVEEFSAAWAELAKPAHIASSVSRAFDTYHREVKSAFASGATDILGPGCFALVAYSMAVVASHRMAFHTV